MKYLKEVSNEKGKIWWKTRRTFYIYLILEIFPIFSWRDGCIFVFCHVEWFCSMGDTISNTVRCISALWACAQVSVSRAPLRLLCVSVLVARQRCKDPACEKVEERWERRKVLSINILNQEVTTPPPQSLTRLRAVCRWGACLFPSSGRTQF